MCHELEAVKLARKPRQSHPRGWDAFEVSLTIKDLRRPTTRALPAPTIDIAAPERLLDRSVEPLVIEGATVMAYSLQRLAGEKLRAFLSSLPTYRQKARKPGDRV